MSILKLLLRGNAAFGGSVAPVRRISQCPLLVLCIAFVSPCNAQVIVASSDKELTEVVIDEIVVTGSRIKRRDFVTPSPLATISSEVIEFNGQATIEETLNQMPQVMPGRGRTSNLPWQDNAGTATVDLRGLGPGRSLVMLNGRRVAPSGTGNAVDLNNIPQFLMDRVEIITGGTSTVYGSDAIAGVVNFITKDDFVGFGIEGGISMAEPGDAESYDFSLAYGHDFASGLGNVAVYASFVERNPLFAADRDHTRIPYFEDWEEGNLVAAGSWTTPAGVVRFPHADLGNGPAFVTFDPDGTPREFDEDNDTYNFAPVMYLQVPLNRGTVGVMGHYDLSERFEGYFEASFIRNEPVQQLAPTPSWMDLDISLDNPMLAPETQQLFADQYSCAPNLACISYSKRFLEMGPRLAEFEHDYSRIVAGFRGELWRGWNIDGWVTYTKGSSLLHMRNDASRSRYLQGLQVDPTTNECFDPTGGCVPLDIFGEGNLSAEGAAFIRLPDLDSMTERTQKLASVFVTGSPFDTWAGSLDLAVGAEWRSEDTSFNADERLFSGDALSFTIRSPVDGIDEVIETYAEAVVPLASNRAWAKYLGLEVGGRYSEYKHAGGMWTYKVGGEWQLFDGFRLRAMHQRSARAPNSRELFEEQSAFNWWFVFDPSEDPCSASADPVGNGNLEKCVLQGLPQDQIGIFEAIPFYPVDFLSGGNPDLSPEVGKTWTVGAVISPEQLPNWVFSVDYFELEVTNTIGDIDAFDICFDPMNTGHVFCENIARDASNNMAQFTELTSNRGLLETTGIDTQIQYQADLPDFLGFRDHFADIVVNVYWTHMLTNKEQENPVTEILDCAGYFGWPCDFRANTFSKNRVTSNMHYASGPLGLHLAWRWIEGTDNAAPLRWAIFGIPDPVLAVPSVGDEHYVDLGVAYTFSDQITARLGVNNLLDNDPPQMANAVDNNNTDTGLYDVFGRSYYFSLSAYF